MLVGMHSDTPEDPLDDAASRRILLLTSKQELTAPAIAYTLDIPLAECYRKIASLVRSGYLTVAGYVINARRRAHKIYRAKLDGVEIFYSRDRIEVRVPKRAPSIEAMNIEVIVPSKRKSR